MKEGLAPRTVRPWRIVAEEASREYDPARMMVLIQELNQALEEQGLLEASDTITEKKTA
jgi:hypothetical protein